MNRSVSRSANSEHHHSLPTGINVTTISTPLPCSLLPGHEFNFDNNKSFVQHSSPVCTEQIDTQAWLSKYGLKAVKLSYQQILSMIGFKQMQGG
jgi:hypothetical protein